MLTDSQQLALTTDSSEAVNAINGFFEQLLNVGNNAQVILMAVEADPDCAMPYGKPSRAPSGARRYANVAKASTPILVQQLFTCFPVVMRSPNLRNLTYNVMSDLPLFPCKLLAI